MTPLSEVKNLVRTWMEDEEGASLVEYILLAVLIGVAAITGLSFLGKAANNRMNNIATAISTQSS